jgi:membrane protein YdbS with pleckstrin-like domain
MPEQTDKFDLWQSKPWWCQPWTIILTGIVLITGSWLALKNLWITLPLSIAIIVWWMYFLVIVPRLLREMRSKD